MEQSVSYLVYLTGGCMAESVWFRHLSDDGMRCERVLCHAADYLDRSKLVCPTMIDLNECVLP